MSDVAKLKKKAAELEQKRQFDRALTVYEELLLAQEGTDDADVSLLNRVGDLRLRLGRSAEALEAYERAVELYVERGFLTNAIALCNKILRQDPQRADVHYRLGRLSAEKGFRSDAKRHFLEYAGLMQGAGRLDDAFAALREFAELSPEHGDVRLMLAEQLAKHGRAEEAVEQLTMLLERYESERRHAEAQAIVERIQAIDPSFAGSVHAHDPHDTDAGGGSPLRGRVTGASRSASGMPELVLIEPTEGGGRTSETTRPSAIEMPDSLSDGAIEPLDLAEPALEVGRPSSEFLRGSAAAHDEMPAAGATGVPAGFADEVPPARLEGLTANGETDGSMAGDTSGVLEGFETTGMGFEETEEPPLSVEIDTSHEHAMSADEPRDDDSLLEDPFLLELGESARAPAEEPLEQFVEWATAGDMPPAVDVASDAASESTSEVELTLDEPEGDELLAFSLELDASGSVGHAPEAMVDDVTTEGSLPAMWTFDDDGADADVADAEAPDTADGAWIPEPGLEMESGEVQLESWLPEAAAAPPTDAGEESEATPELHMTGEGEPVWMAHLASARDLAAAGDRAAALREFAVTLGRMDPDADAGPTAGVLDEMLALDPTAISLHQQRVELATRAGDAKRLTAAYRALAEALAAAGQPEHARATYERLLTVAPEDAAARAAMASLRPRGTPMVQRTIVAPPEHLRGSSLTPAYMAAVTGQPQPAATASDGFVNLGDLLRADDGPRSTRMVVEEKAPTGDEQADFAEMLRKFKQGVAENVDDEDFESHYDLGVAYKEMGLLDEAVASLQRALRGTAHRARTYEALGHCFLEREQYPVASAVLQRALREPDADDEQLVGVLYLLGRAAEAMNQREEALSYYQRVFAIDIEFADVAQRMDAPQQVTR